MMIGWKEYVFKELHQFICFFLQCSALFTGWKVCISVCVRLLPSPTADNAVCVPQIRAFILLPSR